MSKQLTIEQWFARAVAAGIAPNWDNVLAIYDFHYLGSWYLQDGTNSGIINCLGGTDIENGKYSGETIQLRKDGVDLVELWTKEDIPTEKDAGKLAWSLKNKDTIILSEIYSAHKTIYSTKSDTNNDWEIVFHHYDYDEPHYIGDKRSCCSLLLATNGNIAPKPEDFRKAYGE